jgi:PAS domain S-box-containing protein
MKLTYKFFIAIFVFILLVLTSSGFFIFFSIKSFLEESTSNQQVEIARQTMDKIDRFLQWNYSTVQVVATSRPTENYFAALDKKIRGNELRLLEEEVRKRFDDFKQIYSTWEDISMVDLNGTEIFSSNKEEIGENLFKKDIVYQNLFPRVLKGETVYSDLFYSKERQKPTIVFIVPVRTEIGQRIVGAVEAHFSWQAITEILESITNQTANLYNNQGLLISSNESKHESDILSAVHQDDPIVRHAISSGEMPMIAPSSHGKPETLISHVPELGYQNYQGNNWTLIFEIPAKIAFASAKESARKLVALLAAIMIVFILIIIFFINRKILQPISFLTSATEKIASGDLSQKIKIKSKDEIGQLAKSFNIMTEKLRDLYTNLDAKVREKTQESDQKAAELHLKVEELEEIRVATLNILEDVEEERKISEQEKNKLEAILYGIGEAVIVVDQSKKIIIFNPAAEKLLGYKEKEAIGKNYQEIIYITPEDCSTEVSDRFTCKNTINIEQCLLAGKFLTIPANSIVFTKDNKKIYISGASACIKNQDNQIVGSVIVMRDITRERELDRAKTEFISIASHQLRTPLSAIKWFLEMVIGGDAGIVKKEQQDLLDQAYRSNERLITLVNDLLNISRMESGKTKVETKPGVNVDLMIKSIISEITPIAVANNVAINLNPDQIKMPLLPADENKLRQAIINLFSNAIKYNKPRGSVTIKYKVEPEQIVITIADTGLGIPENQQKRMFEKFFRGDNVTVLQTEGTGLGLYITKAIIEGHGGKIWFESVENKGTIFYISLPLK